MYELNLTIFNEALKVCRAYSFELNVEFRITYVKPIEIQISLVLAMGAWEM